MDQVVTKKPFNREKYFKTIISDYNEKTCFNFILDELSPNKEHKYAHATHTDRTYKLTCQMDTDAAKMYALQIKFSDVPHTMNFDDSLNKGQLDQLLKSDAFKTRLGAIEMLDSLNKRAYEEIERLSQNIFNDSIAETEKQDAYDIIMLNARNLLRDK